MEEECLILFEEQKSCLGKKMKMEHWSQGLAGDEPLNFGFEVFSLECDG